MPITIFFCYAREDEAFLNKLKAHLRPLQRQGLIDVWYDRNISPGAEWEPEITKKLNAAQIILLLLSPDFMNSDYCYGIEMQRALERHRGGEATVIPIILRPVYWHGEPLGKLQALPTDGKPVTDPEWHDQDRAFYAVTAGISAVVIQLATTPVSALSSVVEASSQSMTQVSSISSPVQQGRNTTPLLAPLTIEKLTALQTLTGHTHSVNCIALSADGATLVSGSFDKTIRVWNLAIGKAVQTLIGHTGYVYSIALTVDGKTLVSSSQDKTIRVWNLATGEEVQTLIGHTDYVKSIALSANRATLVSGCQDKTIKVWNPATGKAAQTLTGHAGPVYSVALSADGKTLVSGSDDGTVKVWNLATGKEVQTLTGHLIGVVHSVALSADGATLVSGGGDKTVKVWNLSTGKEVQTLTGHTDSVISVALSADGATLVSGSTDQTIKVWNLSTGREVQTLTGHTEAVYCVAFSADGKTLVSGSRDQTIKVWGQKEHSC